jgi:hypothetical protein
METINLKTAITFRVLLGEEEREVAFSTKTFRAKRCTYGKIPEPKDHVPFEVAAITIDAKEPWFDLPKPALVTVIWSNVLSVQYDTEDWLWVSKES